MKIFKTKERRLLFLVGLYIMGVLASNIMAGKFAGILGWSIPTGVFAFPITFAVTDIINEIWGPEEATNTVYLGFTANIVFILMIAFSVLLPPHELWGNQEAWVAVLGSVPRIAIAGLLTFLVSQNWDVWVYNKLKILTGGKHLWIRNNVSTLTSQLLDTALFTILAFAGSMPLNLMLEITFTQWAVKSILAVVDTPFVYLGVNWLRKAELND